MTDITIEDLKEAAEASTGAGDPDPEPEPEPGSGFDGDWIVDLYDRLDSSGRLDRILFGEQREVEEIQAEEASGRPEVPLPEETSGSEPPEPRAASDGGVEAQSGSAGAGIDAEQLKTLMLQLYDHADSIPGLDADPRLSDLIKLVDAHPDTVDQLIEQHL